MGDSQRSDPAGRQEAGGMSAEFAIDPAKVRAWKRYPEYKDSGVEWLGEVPAGWEVKRLKYGVILKSKRVSGREVNLPYIGLENIESWTGKLVQSEETPVSSGQSTLFDPGDVLFGKLRPYLAKVIRAQASGICSSELLVLRPVDITPDFLVNYILNLDFIQAVDASTYGTKMPRANWEFIGNLPILVPPPAVQHAITAFLDRETARIDVLIEKKQRFIELLEEKRQALITQAVTKGLDPDVEMMDSGVEWLGEVPARWAVVKNRFLLDSIEQGWSPLAEDRIAEKDEWAVIKLNAVSKGQFHPLEHKVLSTDYDGKDSWKINTGDFLITRSNTPDLVGDVCLVESVDGKKLIISDLVYKLVYCSRSVDPAFMKYWMLSKAGRYQIVRDARGSSMSMVKISQEIVNSWYVLLPPLSKQHAIAAFLDRETTQVDALIHILAQQIEKLHEYRTALISAAVTGKIDVWGEVEVA